MNRSAPLTRKTPLRARTPLRRSTLLHATAPLPAMSAKRRREQPVRKTCRAVVLERDRTCRFPGCNQPSTDVHELHRGGLRAATWTDPELCIGLCRLHHDYCDERPKEAHDLGLVRWSWEYRPTDPKGATA
jgi:hypothetical protein